MSKFPDWLYKLTPRDEQVTPLEIVSFKADKTELATSVEKIIYTVPKGKVLIVQNMTMWAYADGGAVKNLSASYIANSAGLNQYFWIDQNKGDALNGYLTEQYGAINDQTLIPEDAAIYFAADFTTGGVVAGNQIIGYGSGILIPRGNFAV